MKRFLFLLTIFISFTNVSSLASKEDIFQWSDFDVVVLHGEDLQVVLSQIKSGIKLKEGYDDPSFFVENNNVNYTTQSSINTTYLKSYRLDHRAVSPKYKKSEIRSYYLHVVDNVPPQIISSNSFLMSYGSSAPDLLQGIMVKDNVTPAEEITIIIDDTNVQYDEIGTYPIIYTFIDCSGNSSLHVEHIKIVDLIKPTISKTADLIFQIGNEFHLEDYFLIEDNYDTDLIISYNFEGNIDELGIVILNIVAEDQSGNKEKFNGKLKIVDYIPPTITLKNKTITINVFEELDLLSLVEVDDNYDELSLEDLIITENINFDIVDVYIVIYEIKDNSGNKAKEELKVFVKDLTPPEIYVEDLTIKQNESLDFLMHVKVDDNYSSPNNISLKIVYNNVDFNRPGKYNVTFEAIDESGNHNHKTITVRIQGTTNEQRIFYFLLIGGSILLIAITIVYITKKKKKTY